MAALDSASPLRLVSSWRCPKLASSAQALPKAVGVVQEGTSIRWLQLPPPPGCRLNPKCPGQARLPLPGLPVVPSAAPGSEEQNRSQVKHGPGQYRARIAVMGGRSSHPGVGHGPACCWEDERTEQARDEVAVPGGWSDHHRAGPLLTGPQRSSPGWGGGGRGPRGALSQLGTCRGHPGAQWALVRTPLLARGGNYYLGAFSKN